MHVVCYDVFFTGRRRWDLDLRIGNEFLKTFGAIMVADDPTHQNPLHLMNIPRLQIGS